MMTWTASVRRTAPGPVAQFCLFVPAALGAQVGDVSDVNYPGWESADGVEPIIVETASFEAGGWMYRYTLRNGPGAEQDILEFSMHLANAPWADTAQISAPKGWWRMGFDPSGEIPGLGFMGDQPDPPGLPHSPSPYQIPPGDSLSGFEVTSPYPPGYGRAYVRGFVALPDHPGENDWTVPHDTTDSQRRWTVGPTLYEEVLSRGTGAEPYDGFLGLMSLRATGSVMLDPAPVALELAVDGEEVFPETFRAVLNGMVVTDAFHPGPEDGADLGALFAMGSSPLQSGTNLLVLSVEGIDPATGQRATDLDTVTFTVDPDAAAPSEEPF